MALQPLVPFRLIPRDGRIVSNGDIGSFRVRGAPRRELRPVLVAVALLAGISATPLSEPLPALVDGSLLTLLLPTLVANIVFSLLAGGPAVVLLVVLAGGLTPS